jgi:hypothetical protein
MLAALLLNIPQFSQHGPDRGYTSKRVASSTTWNPRWSEMYGPDAERFKKDKAKIAEAVREFKEAEYVPPALEAAKEVVHARSLVDELDAYKPDTEEYILFVLQAYFVFLAWRNRDDEAIATAILMMD